MDDMNYKIKVYIIATKGVSTISKLIKWRQWGYEYTHVAWVGSRYPRLDDPHVIEAWWSGVEVGPMSKRHTSGTEYSLFSVEVTKEQCVKIETPMREAIGKGYDFAGIFGFITVSKKMHSSKKWFCSELIFAAFKNAGIDLLRDTEPAEVSPRLFLKIPLLKHEIDAVLT